MTRQQRFTALVAEQLRAAIEQSELSYRQLEKATGIPRSSITDLLNGRVRIDVGRLHVLAVICDTTASQILYEAEQ